MNTDQAQRLSNDLFNAAHDERVDVERALVLAFESGKASAVATILADEADWSMVCQWLLEECESMRTDMTHNHDWVYGSASYDWQVCRVCGALKPESDEEN
jgi:hypothetical protein